MSKPRYKWWGYIRNVIRGYPGLKEELNDLHSTNMIAQYGSTGGGRSSDISDSVYKSAIKELPTQKRKEYEAVNAAKWTTEKYPNGKQRVEMIRLMYWCENYSYNLVGAGLKVGYEEAQAKRIHREFVLLVAEYMGMLE